MRVPCWVWNIRESVIRPDYVVRSHIPCEKCDYKATGIKDLKKHIYEKHSY